MKPRYFGNIAAWLNTEILGNNTTELRVIRELLIDSRRLTDPQTSVFFAIVGERHDGHRFIGDLYEQGVRSFVISHSVELQAYPEAGFIQVDSTLDALQSTASKWRDQFAYPVVGITGSNGKTVVKEWLYQLLAAHKNVVRSPKSFNSQVGVPLSVWEMTEEHDIAIIEAGISQPGEMTRLQRIVKPTIGIFTNLGTAHDAQFKDGHQKAREKLDLFQASEVLVYCKDHQIIEEEIFAYPFSTTRFFTWSKRHKADLQIGKVEKRADATVIQGVFNANFIRIEIPFTDEASIENAIHCWAVMLYLGFEQDLISERMLSLAPVAMRLEMKQGMNNCSVINDSYNSDLQSIQIALEFLNQQHQHPKRTVVLSDILQSGRTDQELYAEVAKMMTDKGIDRLIGIGESISEHADRFAMESDFFPNTEAFLNSTLADSFNDETILLKGARQFGFETIGQALQQKTHQTVLEIELGALVHNLNYFRSVLRPETKIMAMVKAFSYGSGSFEIASVLQFHRVDHLAVAYADEGVDLRKAGITIPIMVMNPEEHGYDVMIRHHLEPEIYSLRVLGLLESAIARNSKLTEPIHVHVKLNTGMNRLGFSEAELPELIMRLRNNRKIKVVSMFSHLASSENALQDGFTHQQIATFKRQHEYIQSHFEHSITRHILNSAGIMRFPDAQFDMVRLGIGLYGVSSDPTYRKKLLSVSSLKSHISQIHHLKTGDTVGYGRIEKVETNMTTATVPIGYADGLGREHGNRAGKMMINGFPAPIIGNVCMDMCMLDITGVPAQEGDEVVVFGHGYPIEEFASAAGKIPYEILTGIGSRVKRVYFQE